MILLSIQLAFADAGECVQCCQESKMASCPTQLRVYGEKSKLSQENGRYQLTGFWVLECNGSALFLEDNKLSLSRAPTSGEILQLNAPDTVIDCFEKHCRVPPGSCIEDSDERHVLVNCATKRALTTSQFSMNAPSYVGNSTSGGTSVVIGGQRFEAEILDPQAAILTIPNSSRTLQLPPAPSQDCNTANESRKTSLKRVEQGDHFRLKQLYSQAASEYEAALAIDQCNGLAWSSIGQLAVDTQQLDVAVQSLQTATQLLPNHYGVWTAMGSAYEMLGSQREAMLSYRKALQLSPTYPPAQIGLQRVSNWSQ